MFPIIKPLRQLSLCRNTLWRTLALPTTEQQRGIRKVPKGLKNPKKIMVWPNDWLPFKWEYPEEQVGYFVTGDPEVSIRKMEDLSDEYKRGYDFLKERDVPDSVRNLFKLQNQRRWEIASFIRRKRNAMFMRNPIDLKSHEVTIANYTTKIRYLKDTVRNDAPNDAYSKVLIEYFKGKRNHFLNELVRMDRERYEILVNKLGIEHKPSEAGVMQSPPITRKGELRKLTALYCDRLKREKMEAYHAQLKSEQESFLKEKEETLAWIDREMKKYGITEEDAQSGFKPRLKYRDPPVPRKPVEES